MNDTSTKVNTAKNFLGSMSGEDLQAMFQALQEMMDEGEEQAAAKPGKRFMPYKIGSKIPDEVKMQYMRQTERGTWKWMPNRLAEHICELTDARLVDGVCWFRDGSGEFVCLDAEKNLLDRITYWHYSDVNPQQMRDLRDTLTVIAPIGRKAPVNLVAFKGPDREMQILDLDTRTVHTEEEYDDNIFFLNVIPHALPTRPDGSIDWDYTNETTDQLLHGIACDDPEIVMQLEELVGYPMFRDSFQFKKCFVLWGNGDNGKSALVKSIAALYGGSNVSYLNIDELGAEFKTIQLMGKMVNLSDDMTGGYLTSSEVALLKSLSAGGDIVANRKYKEAVPMTCYAKLVFAANDLAGMQDRSGAVANRFQIIPLRQDFKKVANKDVKIADKMRSEEAQQALIIYGLRGLLRILDTGHFTETAATEEANHEMRANNNSIIQWLEDGDENARKQLIGEPPKAGYEKYKTWCIFSGLKPVGYKGWQKEVCDNAGLEVVLKQFEENSKRIFVTTKTLENCSDIFIREKDARKQPAAS